MDVDGLRRLPLFEGTDEDALQTLLDDAEEVAFRSGEVLFRAGRPIEHWWVLVEGRIDLVRRTSAQESVVRSMDTPGQWIGALGAWDRGAHYLADGHAVRDGLALRIPLAVLRPVLCARSPLADHLLDGLVGSLRHIEASLHDAESLMALGTLAAGLAHELNNPAAAVSRAMATLAEGQETAVATGRRLAAASVPHEGLEALDELRRELGPLPAPDPMALADREEALSDWLGAHGVARSWRLAPVLAAHGADLGWCERVAGVLGSALDPGLESVVSTLSVTRSLVEARDAAARISGLVAAVKSYTQLDRGAVQPVDVRAGLDSTLAVLASRIPAGVTVVADHGEDLPRIEAAGAELNQVWTQLLGNALDAMDATGGTLRVTTRADDDGGVRVEIGDTGTGMPPEVLRHAFDPFFTTKPVGRGAGLGLDVARRIVQRHGGRIAIDSRPGCTVVDVRLSARLTAPAP